MSQGGYGGGYGGGPSGYGSPPGGGWGPPQGGYGPPSGGAPPPGGGWGPPQGGYGGPPPGFGGAPPQRPKGGPERFLKAALIGGAIGGVASSLPILNLFNCCFCLLNMGGAAMAVGIYLKDSPSERIGNGDAALCGGFAGMTAGVVVGILGVLMQFVAGSAMVALYGHLASILPPDILSKMTMQMGMSFAYLPLYVILYGAFGALGGFLSLHLFFKDRADG